MIQQELDGDWSLRQVGSQEWLKARVPGGVHLDLMAAGRIPDPFVEDGEQAAMWVAEADWEYRREFRVDPALAGQSHVEIVFEGLDTLAEVRFNGELIGTANNMFRTWRWDITSRILPGGNEVTVTFRSAVRRAAALDSVRHLDAPEDQMPGAPYIRKAPCHFGWDWGPRLANVGLWRGIHLQGWTGARFDDVHVSQDIVHGRAVIGAHVQVERHAGRTTDLATTLRVEHPGGRIDTARLAMQAGITCDIAIHIDQPELWWPHGHGEQPLYGVVVELADGDAVLDRRSYKVGLRALELRREPDDRGESFIFGVNGVPIFGRGSNWIPADVFPARADGQRLRSLLRAAVAANHNMIRVWGGGYYESDEFYDECDRLGVLVWQDFMFSCSVYPMTDESFLANVRAEAEEQVRRLRHHSCLALWCGNNEMERGWAAWGWDRPANQGEKVAYLRFFGETLPALVHANDPVTPYWPSSPSSGRPLVQGIGPSMGDEHEWNVWHGMAPVATYARETFRFITEFGFEAYPAPATITAFAPAPADRQLGSRIMDLHQRCPDGDSRILFYLAQLHRLPRNFDALVYLSQIVQADAMRLGVEHWRRGRSHCAGALYWQLNDCWPCSSWSSLDYFGRWKALHYVSRRFFAPVLLSCELRGSEAVISVTNDLAESWLGEVRWDLQRLDGRTVSSGKREVEAKPLANTRVITIPVPEGIEERRRAVLVAELHDTAALIPETRPAQATLTFLPDKYLALRVPRIEVSIVRAPSGPAGEPRAEARLHSSSLARWVELRLEAADVVFDDNYFDLPAGKEARVRFDLPAGWDLDQARAQLRVRSLIDAYQQTPAEPAAPAAHVAEKPAAAR